MCRELRREPAWVGAIRLAIFQGELDVESVIEEANLVPGTERTVTDILETMEERSLLTKAPDFEESGRYLVGPVLLRSASQSTSQANPSDRAIHRWQTTLQ